MAMSSRDRAIASAYRLGRRRGDIAAEHGITARRVSQIVKAAGVTGQRKCAAPEPRRKGRPRDAWIAALTREDEALYRKARRYFGADAAREMLGFVL